MKNKFYLTLILFVALLANNFNVSAQNDVINNGKIALKSGSSKELVKYFNDIVELSFDGEKSNYSKTQAEFVLKDFFKKYPPLGKSKLNDFNSFVKVIEIMDKREHSTIEGMRKIARIAEKMTHRKPFEESSIYKFLLSSETIRRARPNVGLGKI